MNGYVFLILGVKVHQNTAHTLWISGDIAQENEDSTDITQ